MKIGIFGDSYATDYDGDNSWVNLLASEFDVTTHAIGGTSYEWAYHQFLKHHEKYDRIVFFKTNQTRTTVFNFNEDGLDMKRLDDKEFIKLTEQEQLDRIEPAFAYMLFDGFERITIDNEEFVNTEFSDTDKQYCDAYQELVCDYPYTNYVVHHAIKNSIDHMRHSVLHLNSFPCESSTSGMFNISALDMSKFKGEEVFGARLNHMSRQQSHEFYTYMRQHLLKGFDVASTMTRENVGKFYTLSATADIAGIKLK